MIKRIIQPTLKDTNTALHLHLSLDDKLQERDISVKITILREVLVKLFVEAVLFTFHIDPMTKSGLVWLG